MADVLDRIAELVEQHRTTLVFVNTRRLAERLAHQLEERLGEDHVAAHHGSLSRERRYRVERRLRAGDLRALVATASLELGIDVGPVELVCQIGSPRSIATLLQRVGRSNHTRSGTPRGRLYPLTRDELVECTALLGAIRAGRLDTVTPPIAPLDILGQQLVAEVAAGGVDARRPVRPGRAGPIPTSTSTGRRSTRSSTWPPTASAPAGAPGPATCTSTGSTARSGPARGPGWRRSTSGGAIPELGDYRVVAEPEETFIGTVNEDWAVESMAGDIFLLGTTSWRIRKVEPGVVRVVDANGAAAVGPVLAGRGPGPHRRAVRGGQPGPGDGRPARRRGSARPGPRDGSWPPAGSTTPPRPTVVDYLAAGRAGLGVMPTTTDLVFERFFDESGGMQLVIHSPLGGRLNRALGLALRKKFCRSFNFELQAAASDDAVVLSLGPHHSFPLEDVPNFITTRHRRGHAAPGRARLAAVPVPLAVEPQPLPRGAALAGRSPQPAAHPAHGGRRHDGRRVPRGRRLPGEHHRRHRDPRPSDRAPDHARHPPRGARRRRPAHAARRHRGRPGPGPLPRHHRGVAARPRDPHRPALRLPRRRRGRRSSHQRRARCAGACPPRRCPPARSCPRPSPRCATRSRSSRPVPTSCATCSSPACWSPPTRPGRRCSTSWRRRGGRRPDRPSSATAGTPSSGLTRSRPSSPVTTSPAARESRPRPTRCGASSTTRGPITVAELARRARGGPDAGRGRPAGPRGRGQRPAGSVHRLTPTARHRRRAVVRPTPAGPHPRLQPHRRRREIEPVPVPLFMRFLLAWHGLTADRSPIRVRPGVVEVIEQLQGVEAAAGSWESDVLARRVRGYRPEWLDRLCHQGDVSWLRLRLPEAGRGANGGPSKATPMTLVFRGDLDWLLTAHRGEVVRRGPRRPGPPPRSSRRCDHGARFLNELTGRHRSAAGRDRGRPVGRRGPGAAHRRRVRRHPVVAPGPPPGRCAVRQSVSRLRRGAPPPVRAGGRWSLVGETAPPDDHDELVEAVADQLLARWGVVFRDLVAHERLAVPWRDLQWALRRFEDRGMVRGGRFVDGPTGEQFALPRRHRPAQAGPQGRRRRRSGRDRRPPTRSTSPVSSFLVPALLRCAPARSSTSTGSPNRRPWAASGSPVSADVGPAFTMSSEYRYSG